MNGPQFGMGESEWAAQRPPLTPENRAVCEIWDFCGGWKPEALPVALAFHDVVDIDFLVEQLKLIRDRIAARDEAAREKK